MLAADPVAVTVSGPVVVLVSSVLVVSLDDPELVASVRSMRSPAGVNDVARAVANTPTTREPAGAVTAGAVSVLPEPRT